MSDDFQMNIINAINAYRVADNTFLFYQIADNVLDRHIISRLDHSIKVWG